METLDGTDWDVVIAETGFAQSLLALSLSRSGQRILHLDPNEYYGGNEAALSLAEAEAWALKHDGNGETTSSVFTNATIRVPSPDAGNSQTKLFSSRAYSLALAPHVVYARSSLLPALVSSQIHNQLEFQAVGSWFTVEGGGVGSTSPPRLTRVPNGREDIFRDKSFDLKAKRALMKFVRFVGNYEEQAEWETLKTQSFASVLKDYFGLPEASHQPLLALALVPEDNGATNTEQAVTRIARHLRSIGIFGPGFSAVFPKWGGLAEVSQVACRACAVGGGVYVLKKSIKAVSEDSSDTLSLQLDEGELVQTRWLVGANDTVAQSSSQSQPSPVATVTKSITVVSSALTSLFPRTSEGGVIPAGAIVRVSMGSNQPPVHIVVHSEESGECPSNQCILYASVAGVDQFDILQQAVVTFLRAVEGHDEACQLWSLQYEQHYPQGSKKAVTRHDHIVALAPLSADLAIDDAVLDDVKAVWRSITGGDEVEFLKYEPREALADDE